MIKKAELQQELFAAYDYIEKHMGTAALNEIMHHTDKEYAKHKYKVERLQHELMSAYMFIEMMCGKDALKNLRLAAKQEHTDRVLEAKSNEEFEMLRASIPDANYFEYAPELFK